MLGVAGKKSPERAVREGEEEKGSGLRRMSRKLGIINLGLGN